MKSIPLDKVICLFYLVICIVYGYGAFVTLEEGLLPFERTMAILPNSFPKILAVLGCIASFNILLTPSSLNDAEDSQDINYRRLFEYKLYTALSLFAMMAAYAFLLRPLGFLLSTTLFLMISAIILGERKIIILGLISAISSGGIWYLVQEVLGIFMRPLPIFLAG